MKLGIVTDSLARSQPAFFMIKNVNQKLRESRLNNICFFSHDLNAPCIQPFTSVMHVNELFTFDGEVIAVNIGSADKLIKAPGPVAKYFYLWDLEWLRMPHKSFEGLYNIYASRDLKLITRCDAHARAVEDAWNVKPIAVVPDFDMNKLFEAIYGNDKPAGK